MNNRPTLIKEKSSSITVAILLQKRLYEAGIIADTLSISIVAIDKNDKMGSLKFYLCTFIIAGGCSHPTLLIAVDGQPMNINHAPSNTLVRFAFTSDAQCQRIANKLGRVKASYAIPIADRSQINKVHQRVNLIQLLALQHSTDKGFRSRTIA